jgi:hypothetical protein
MAYNAKNQYRKMETNIPRKELHGHSPNFQGIYKSLTLMWKLGLRSHNS